MASSKHPRAISMGPALAIVLLLLTSQVFSHPILENQILLEEMSQDGAAMSSSWMDDISLQSLRRFTRMTPFWRMVGSKPIGAYCLQGLECTTKICRKGHCAYQQQFES